MDLVRKHKKSFCIKRRSILVCIVILMVCNTACNNSVAIKFIDGFSRKIFINPYYGLDDPNTPSTDDRIKYRQILDELMDFSRAEDEIFEEIAPKYGMTFDEIKEFMDNVMPYDTGIIKYIPDDEQVKTCVELSLSEVIEGNFTLPTSINDWDIIYLNKSEYNTKVNIETDKRSHELSYNIIFNFTYETFQISWVTLDGKVIRDSS